MEFVQQAGDTFKKHPYLIGGAALLVILIAARSGGAPSSSSASASGFAAGLQAMSLQEQAGIASQQISAAQAVQTAQDSAAIHVADNQTLATALATLVGAKVTSDQNSQAFQLQTQQTKAAQDVATAQINGGLQLQQTSLADQLAAYGQSIGLQTQALNANTQLANKQLDITNSNLPQVLAFNEYLAGVNQGTTLGVAQIQGNTAQNVAQTNANVAYANLAAKSVGGIGNLFSSLFG
jgi:hypothetical protein